MKFPSIIKTPKFSRFHYEPRYYDPVKEDIQRKIKAAEIRAQSVHNDTEFYSTSISEGFNKRERKSNQASVMQMIIAAALIISAVGWWTWGNDFLYTYLLLTPIYFYFRFRKPKA